MKRSTVVAAALCCAFTGAQAFQAADLVAEVGGRKILASDLREELLARRKQDITRNKLDAFTAAGRDVALRDLIDRALFSTAARAEGLDRDPDVARRLRNVVDQFLAEAELTAIAGTRPTDEAALRAYYSAHPDEFRAPSQIRARHIVVKTREEAEALRAQLNTGADFADLAREKNIDSTRATGGDLGLVRKGVMVAAFDQALFATKPGAVSSVVQTSFGFHLIKVDAIEEGTVPAFETVKDAVARAMLGRRITEARERLEQQYPVRIDKNALAQVDR